MQPPEALLARVRTSWVRHRHAWLAGEGRWPLEFPVGTPTQAEVAANWSGFDAWLRRWREHRGAGQVRYIDRSWSKLGQQQVPRCWSFDAPESVAEALGEAERWIRASRRYGNIGHYRLSQRRVVAEFGLWLKNREGAGGQFDGLLGRAKLKQAQRRILVHHIFKKTFLLMIE